jgi:hypothetical protein
MALGSFAHIMIGRVFHDASLFHAAEGAAEFDAGHVGCTRDGFCLRRATRHDVRECAVRLRGEGDQIVLHCLRLPWPRD